MQTCFFSSLQQREISIRILKGLSWSFNKQLVDYDANVRPMDYVFDRASFWIQVYGLPLNIMNNFLWAASEHDDQGDCEKDREQDRFASGIDCQVSYHGWGRFLRMKVEMISQNH